MITKTGAMVLAIAGLGLSLGACAPGPSPHGFGGVRTVFHNPYAAMEVANGPVGPTVCEERPSTNQCWLDGLIYLGRGDFAYDRAGNRVRLSRSDRRALRERFELIRDQTEINRRVKEFDAMQARNPPVPVPTAPPIVSSVPPVAGPPTPSAPPSPPPVLQGRGEGIEP